MKNLKVYITTAMFFFISFITLGCIYSQDTVFIDTNFKNLTLNENEYGISPFSTDTFELGEIRHLHFESFSEANDTLIFGNKHNYYRIIICNRSEQQLDISISGNSPDSMQVYFYNNTTDELSQTQQLNIRGLSLYGRIQIPAGDTQEIFVYVKSDDRIRIGSRRALQFRLINYNYFLQEELPNRFIDSLLIGLLLFSAILNLILGIILKRKSFITLFFYLMTLVLFSFSFLGFYDEFIIQKSIRIPISLPVYFVTLILFLQVSKQYLQLNKNLPGWNTITNVIMFFLILSVPYYYLTVYIESLYNSYLAFSSLFFFVIAAVVGLIESIILFHKEPKSKYFLVATLLVIISMIINIFLENKYPVVVGSVLQGFIFTIGLAEEIKILDGQKHRFQQRYIKQLEVNLRLNENLTVELEKKVEDRTKKLKFANDELVKKNKIVEMQKELLEVRNKEIKDSIEYAKRIQTASFPSRRIIEKVTSDYFILYKPRDIVSGDFYWFGEVEDKIILISADCTGHGVPGAFMSMYGIAFLNEIINKEKIYYPDNILNSLREKISSSLNRGDDEFETMDGMDMAIITIDQKNNMAHYAGANNSLYYIKDTELEIIKADKMPVAFYQKMDPFTSHQIPFTSGDIFYIFTDGIIDQFGGELGKKFLSRRLKDVLLEISHLSMAEQYRHLEEAFLEWKGDYFQVDDILMIGMRM